MCLDMTAPNRISTRLSCFQGWCRRLPSSDTASEHTLQLPIENAVATLVSEQENRALEMPEGEGSLRVEWKWFQRHCRCLSHSVGLACRTFLGQIGELHSRSQCPVSWPQDKLRQLTIHRLRGLPATQHARTNMWNANGQCANGKHG